MNNILNLDFNRGKRPISPSSNIEETGAEVRATKAARTVLDLTPPTSSVEVPFRGVLNPNLDDDLSISVLVKKSFKWEDLKPLFREDSDDEIWFPNCKELDLTDCSNEELSDFLAKLGKFGFLNLKSVALFGINFSSTEFGQSFFNELIEKLEKFTSFEKLDFRTCLFSQEQLQQLGQCKQLKGLSLFNCNLDKDDLQTLKSAENLNYLDLSNNNIGGGLVHLEGLDSLKSLYCCFCQLEKEDFEALQSFKQLEVLDLSQNDTREKLKFLKPLKSLQVLDLSRAQVQCSSFNHLSSLTYLRELTLYGNEITLDQLKSLPILPLLDTLDLTDNKIQFEPFSILAPKVPSLTTLNLTRNPVSTNLLILALSGSKDLSHIKLITD